MLKLRNAVLTALLAFCLAMPFVSCSFNDGATGDVSDKVTLQSGNNQNGGNGGSTGGSGTNSGEDEDHDHDNNGENKNPSGGNNGGSGESEKPTDPTVPETPVDGEVTVYTVTLDGEPLVDENGNAVTIPAAALDHYKTFLTEGDDYTIRGNTIDLTQAGYQKVMNDAMSGAGEGGEPGYDEGTTYVVKYNGDIIEESLPESMWSYGKETVDLIEGVDYTMNGKEITLTPTGYNKVLPLLESSNEHGEHGYGEGYYGA